MYSWSLLPCSCSSDPFGSPHLFDKALYILRHHLWAGFSGLPWVAWEDLSFPQRTHRRRRGNHRHNRSAPYIFPPHWTDRSPYRPQRQGLLSSPVEATSFLAFDRRFSPDAQTSYLSIECAHQAPAYTRAPIDAMTTPLPFLTPEVGV